MCSAVLRTIRLAFLGAALAATGAACARAVRDARAAASGLGKPVPGLTSTTAQLSPRDQESIRVTLARYALGTDSIDCNMLAQTYTADATLTAIVAGRDTLSLTGRDAITTFVINTRKAQHDIRRHNITNIVAERVRDGEAVVHAYFEVVTTVATQVSVLSTGIYNIRMVCCHDGVWRIAQEDVLQDAPAI
jgi:hypothetical protein